MINFGSSPYFQVSVTDSVEGEEREEEEHGKVLWGMLGIGGMWERVGEEGREGGWGKREGERGRVVKKGGEARR